MPSSKYVPVFVAPVHVRRELGARVYSRVISRRHARHAWPMWQAFDESDALGDATHVSVTSEVYFVGISHFGE